MAPQLRLPDKSNLPVDDVMNVVASYRLRGPAIIDLYDLTNDGPHDEIRPIDLLSLTAMSAFGRAPAMPPITAMWNKRALVPPAVSAIKTCPIEHMSSPEQHQCAVAVCNAITTIQTPVVKGFGPAPTSKLLHRLRPGAIPIWDRIVSERWYAEFIRDPDWMPWITQVYTEVTEPANAESLQIVRDRTGLPLSLIRFWDIILWEIAMQERLSPN